MYGICPDIKGRVVQVDMEKGGYRWRGKAFLFFLGLINWVRGVLRRK